MKKCWITFLLCGILLLTATAGQAQEEQSAEEHDFAVYVNAAGIVYDHKAELRREPSGTVRDGLL